MHPPSSPTRHKQSNVLPGFRPAPRQRRPIAEMTVRELKDLYELNSRVLASPNASTSSYVQRVSQEQALIESRLLDLDGIEKLNQSLKGTRIRGEGDIQAGESNEPPSNSRLEAKRRALAKYGSAARSGLGPSMTMQEAIELEQQGHLANRERQQRLLEKKKRQGLPIRGEILTREEQEARIWAFMNYKPTDSDLEDDEEDNSDEDSEDEDPSTWFEDDQEDGIKGQNIVEPDFEDELSNIIQVDHSRIPYSNIYPSQGD